MVQKVAEIGDLVALGRRDLRLASAALKQLARSDDWTTREVAATALVEISRKSPDAVIRLAATWADSDDPNVRRAASEGLRHVARVDADAVLPVLARLKRDESPYVRKSVANVLRDAGKRNPEWLLSVCAVWLAENHKNTNSIVKSALSKLRETDAERVDALLSAVSQR